MKRAYKTRPIDFKRRIIKRIYSNRSDLLKEENRYLNMIKLHELKNKYYNIQNREFGHWSTDEEKSNAIKQKVAWNKGLSKLTNLSILQQSKKVSNTLKGRATRKEWTVEQRAAKSNQVKQMLPEGPFKGKKHSDESKQKMRNAALLRRKKNKCQQIPLSMLLD